MLIFLSIPVLKDFLCVSIFLNFLFVLCHTFNKCEQTYTGARFNQTLDWALSSVGDDVTAFIQKLTDMEKRLYYSASIAATNHQIWKLHGNNHHRNRRATGATKKPSFQSRQQIPSSSNQRKENSIRTVTPTSDSMHRSDERPRQGKRMKT